MKRKKDRFSFRNVKWNWNVKIENWLHRTTLTKFHFYVKNAFNLYIYIWHFSWFKDAPPRILHWLNDFYFYFTCFAPLLLSNQTNFVCCYHFVAVSTYFVVVVSLLRLMFLVVRLNFDLFTYLFFFFFFKLQEHSCKCALETMGEKRNEEK